MTDLVPILIKSLKLSLGLTFLQVAMIYFPYLLMGKMKKVILNKLLFFNYLDFMLSGVYLFIIIFVFELSGITSDNTPLQAQHPFLYILFLTLAMVFANGFFGILFPILLKKQTNRLEPLPQYSQLLKEKFNVDIPVYTTKKGLMNAFAIGFFPTNKLIVLGNEVIANFEDDEIEAILYHEYAHHKNRDLIYFYAVFIGLCLSLGYFRDNFITLLKNVFPSIDDGLAIFVWGSVNGLIFVCLLFSRLSHRAEYKADSFSAMHTNDDSMIRALQKLSLLTEHIIDKGSMTHPSLEKRIQNITVSQKS